MPMHARAQRLARGWIVGLVATTVAAVSHSLAGGYQPGLLSFGVALIFAGMLGTLVIGRRPSLPRLSMAVGGAQLAFHLVFSLLGTGGPATASSGTGMAGMAGMPMPGMGMTTVAGAAGGSAASTHDMSDLGMWVAHAVAAVLTILFLRRAELAVWTILTRLGRLLVSRAISTPVPAPVSAAPRLPVDPITTTVIERVLVASAWRRGPPLLAF